MAGSSFIWVGDEAQLADFSLELVEAHPHVHLDRLVTLDFELSFSTKNDPWITGEPVHFDAEGGVAVFPVSPRALTLIKNAARPESELHQDDIAALQRFLIEYGCEQIYEVTTY